MPVSSCNPPRRRITHFSRREGGRRGSPEKKGSTTLGVPESSLTSVLTKPEAASLLKSDGLRIFQLSMVVPNSAPLADEAKQLRAIAAGFAGAFSIGGCFGLLLHFFSQFAASTRFFSCLLVSLGSPFPSNMQTHRLPCLCVVQKASIHRFPISIEGATEIVVALDPLSSLTVFTENCPSALLLSINGTTLQIDRSSPHCFRSKTRDVSILASLPGKLPETAAQRRAEALVEEILKDPVVNPRLGPMGVAAIEKEFSRRNPRSGRSFLSQISRSKAFHSFLSSEKEKANCGGWMLFFRNPRQPKASDRQTLLEFLESLKAKRNSAEFGNISGLMRIAQSRRHLFWWTGCGGKDETVLGKIKLS